MKEQIPVRMHAVAESPEPPVDDYQHLPICGWGCEYLEFVENPHLAKDLGMLQQEAIT